MYEGAVGRCYSIIKLWGNPFQKNENIFGLSSRVEVPLNTVDDLLQAEKIGESCFKEILKNRIETNNVDFYTPLNTLKLNTFDKRSAPTKINVKNKDVAIRSDRETFTGLLVIQKNHNISLKEVVQIELSPTLISPSNPDSSTTLRKTAKTELVVIHKLPPTLVSFGDISDYILRKTMKAPSRVSFFIPDYYLEDSVKSLELRCRSDIGLIRMKASRKDQHVPKQFNKFLRLSPNKIELVKFLIEDWLTNEKHCCLFEANELYVTVEDRAC